MEALLHVQDLTVRFGSDGAAEIPAVNGASFQINVGEVVGLLGESGCGKSTAALALVRLLPPAGRLVRGSIRFGRRELLAASERELEQIRGAEISLILQEPGMALNPVMRVGEQIADVIRAHRAWSRARCREEARAVLAQVHLADTARIYAAYPHQLSGGQRQRVVIAQALACKPALIIADEPTAALDASIQADVLTLFRELKERFRIALLFITHNPALLAGLADRVMVMYAGHIVEEGSLEQVCRSPLHPYTQGLLRSVPPRRRPDNGPQKKELPAIAGSPPDPARLPPGCPFEPRCPERMEVCLSREPAEAQPEPARRVRCFKYGG